VPVASITGGGKKVAKRDFPRSSWTGDGINFPWARSPSGKWGKAMLLGKG